MPFPMFGYGGGREEQEGEINQDQHAGMAEPPSSPDIPPTTNEYGDPWLTDEQAGVGNPDDHSFMDTLSDFFKDSD